MSDTDRTLDEERWEQANNDFLAVALHWLRLRLDRAAVADQPAPDASEPASPRRRFGRRDKDEPILALPAGGTDEPERAANDMAAAADIMPPPALHILAERLGLSTVERDLLLLCASVELDTSMAGRCARAQDAVERPYPTFALALALLDHASWDVMSPERPLRHWRLIEIDQRGAQPLTTSALRADERIVNHIKGLSYLDDRLTPLLVPFDMAQTGQLATSQEAVSARIEVMLRRAADDGALPITIQLTGPDAASIQLVARRAAERLGLQACRLPADLLPAQTTEMETLTRLWEREQRLLPLALFIDAHEVDDAASDGAAVARIARFVARTHGVVMVGTREVQSLGVSTSVHAVDTPTPAEQQQAWTTHLDDGADGTPSRLAAQFDLNVPTIERIARDVRATSEGPPDGRALWEGCLAATGTSMHRLAQRLRPVATWDDIVLPDEQMDLLRQLTAQVANRARVYDDWGYRARTSRGLGISALFAGESGTGKTMAAEVIANHLRLHLYRIDLSAVVSKYIGETEKNLRRLFDAAEGGGAILFFDEADALFGKRSEVRDSHDRYANIEINYLLQRMESYRGLAILATNMRDALDHAFLRRLRFIVTFPFPGRPQRRAIWEHAWTSGTPVGELDLDRLSRLHLTGGSIASVALNAAFVAADHDVPVTMPIVLDAARAEYRKLERPVNDAEFRWDTPARGAGAEARPKVRT